MSLVRTSRLAAKYPSYQPADVLVLSSRKAISEQHRPDPSLRKMLGHTRVFSETERMMHSNFDDETIFPPLSYLARRSRRKSRPFLNSFDDEADCPNTHGGTTHSCDSDLGQVRSISASLLYRDRQTVEESCHCREIQVRVTTIAVEELEAE
ncbi:hypothetical protein PV10_08250 [Exophiala mesophila]|uniref:Uncharacterized protein n=1 Tax=Exophiala mesophila TaxID=212818 RepID=A0A0D1WID6_EXOME|nr:uncharacterized protein PV10_08250 [Exophiala mesophila]KIV88580.1 hypothetical protein PV10_08250 [Exophiala mesophila]